MLGVIAVSPVLCECLILHGKRKLNYQWSCFFKFCTRTFFFSFIDHLLITHSVPSTNLITRDVTSDETDKWYCNIIKHKYLVFDLVPGTVVLKSLELLEC